MTKGRLGEQLRQRCEVRPQIIVGHRVELDGAHRTDSFDEFGLPLIEPPVDGPLWCSRVPVSGSDLPALRQNDLVGQFEHPQVGQLGACA